MKLSEDSGGETTSVGAAVGAPRSAGVLDAAPVALATEVCVGEGFGATGVAGSSTGGTASSERVGRIGSGVGVDWSKPFIKATISAGGFCECLPWLRT